MNHEPKLQENKVMSSLVSPLAFDRTLSKKSVLPNRVTSRCYDFIFECIEYSYVYMNRRVGKRTFAP